MSHSSRPRKGKGTGLGLATVYGIVKQSQGFVFADSNPGEGTTFDIYFPSAEAPQLTAPPPPASRPHCGHETILLVEDQQAVRLLLTHALSDYGYTLLEASSGREALRLVAAAKTPIHILLTDVVMPQMTGPALAERLRQQWPDLRVLFMSGYAEGCATDISRRTGHRLHSESRSRPRNWRGNCANCLIRPSDHPHRKPEQRGRPTATKSTETFRWGNREEGIADACELDFER